MLVMQQQIQQLQTQVEEQKTEIQGVYAQNDVYREKLNERNAHICMLETEKDTIRAQADTQQTHYLKQIQEFREERDQ